jgi:glycosyltransferase involved in cell wall biosynthesis
MQSAPSPKLTLTFSLAEQSFTWTRSIGLLNLSVKLVEQLAQRPEIERLHVLSNSTQRGHLSLPSPVRVTYHDEANGRGLSRMWWDQWRVYSEAWQAGNEWLFMPKGFVSFLRRCPVRLAAYVPDVMFDHYERAYPGQFSRLEAFYLKQSVRAALRQSAVIFTCSEFTNAELTRVARTWRIQPPRLVALGTGFSPDKLKVPAEKANRIIVLASPWAHKRTDLALQFMDRWQQAQRFDGQVDLVGSLPRGLSLPPRKGWQLHQRLPEPDYRRMVASARALVYFTEYEGFGMPPVEAIIGGTCSVYSDIPATREVMRGAGAPFENNSYESFARAMALALHTQPAELARWEQELLMRHSGEKGAETVVRALLQKES